MKNKELKKKIIDISYSRKLSHIGSCLAAVDTIEAIHAKIKKENNGIFVLSSGHAGLAYYVVLEKYNVESDSMGLAYFPSKTAEMIFDHHGTHPDRCGECGIAVSSGSLGQGLPIAVGMALADRTKQIYCMVSDGECAEGSIWEALRISQEQHLDNLHVYVIYNGYGAYSVIQKNLFLYRFSQFISPGDRKIPGFYSLNIYIIENKLNKFKMVRRTTGALPRTDGK